MIVSYSKIRKKMFVVCCLLSMCVCSLSFHKGFTTKNYLKLGMSFFSQARSWQQVLEKLALCLFSTISVFSILLSKRIEETFVELFCNSDYYS